MIATGGGTAVALAAVGGDSASAVAAGAATVGAYAAATSVVASTGVLTSQVMEYVMFSKASKQSGKEKANDMPSWSKGQKPQPGESGKDFARRLCDDKFGPGNYKTGPASDFNRIKNWGDRGFKAVIAFIIGKHDED